MYTRKKRFTFHNWIVFIIFTFLCGAVAGAVTGSFLQIIRLAADVLWREIPQKFLCVNVSGQEINLYCVIPCITGGILIGLWQRKYGDYPILLNGIIGMYKRDKNIPYDKAGVVFLAALMPIMFGGSVGPEAGLAGIVVMLFCWIRDKYKSYIFYFLDSKEKGMHPELAYLIRNPVRTFIGEKIQYDRCIYEIEKGIKWTAYISAAAGGVSAFYFVSELMAQGYTEIVRFDSFSYTSKELLWFFPVVILGIFTGLLFLYSKKAAIYMYKPLRNKKIMRAVITGLILSVTGMFFPHAMFSGQDQMADVVTNWQNWTVPMLFATGFIKIVLINCCVYGGWKGGSFFPCLFCATVIGYGVACFIPAEQTFVILTFMASFTAMSLGQPIVIIALCMLFAPIAAFLPIVGAAFAGGWINKKSISKIITPEELRAAI